MDALTSFLKRVRKTETCWLWTGGKIKGYGKFTEKRTQYLAHRWLYAQMIGPIPEGLHLDHLCRTPSCVNPAHLEPVTCKVNINRGIGPQLARERQLAKTHCPKGHPYDEENTKYSIARNGRPHRRCRTCHREQEKLRAQNNQTKDKK